MSVESVSYTHLLDDGTLQLQLLLTEGLDMIHLRRAVDGQLADELEALGVEVIDGRDPCLLYTSRCV